MKIYDISMDIYHDMPVYKGKTEKRPLFSADSDYRTGSVYETRVEINMHTGTHLDSPYHMLEDGEKLESISLDKVITRCTVLDLTDANDKISKADLERKNIKESDFILLKTKNSHEDILEGDFIYLDKSGAEYLRDKKIKGVGIDALGIERNQPDHPAHKILFKEGIVVLEGLRLSGIEEGEYFLFAAPIKLKNVEAAPVRAVLVKGL
ncbi:MAG TPA: cyclase family protein [Clostridiaceae bacterium]|nr:cyclase family protein [Clostridiaceae bacterium]